MTDEIKIDGLDISLDEVLAVDWFNQIAFTVRDLLLYALEHPDEVRKAVTK